METDKMDKIWRDRWILSLKVIYKTQRAVGLNNQTKKAMMFINFAN